MNCNRCGKFMTSLTGQNLAGLAIQVKVPPNDLATGAFVQRQFGKHKVGAYTFCIECVLDTMMAGKETKIIKPQDVVVKEEPKTP